MRLNQTQHFREGQLELYRYLGVDGTLFNIARRFHTSVDQLRALNAGRLPLSCRSRDGHDWATLAQSLYGSDIRVPYPAADATSDWHQVSPDRGTTLADLCAEVNRDPLHRGAPDVTPAGVWFALANADLRRRYLAAHRLAEDPEPARVTMTPADLVAVPYPIYHRAAPVVVAPDPDPPAQPPPSPAAPGAQPSAPSAPAPGQPLQAVVEIPAWLTELQQRCDAIARAGFALQQINRECQAIEAGYATLRMRLAWLGRFFDYLQTTGRGHTDQLVALLSLKQQIDGCDALLRARVSDPVEFVPSEHSHERPLRERQEAAVHALLRLVRDPALARLALRALLEPQHQLRRMEHGRHGHAVPALELLSDTLRRAVEVLLDAPGGDVVLAAYGALIDALSGGTLPTAPLAAGDPVPDTVVDYLSQQDDAMALIASAATIFNGTIGMAVGNLAGPASLAIALAQASIAKELASVARLGAQYAEAHAEILSRLAGLDATQHQEMLDGVRRGDAAGRRAAATRLSGNLHSSLPFAQGLYLLSCISLVLNYENSHLGEDFRQHHWEHAAQTIGNYIGGGANVTLAVAQMMAAVTASGGGQSSAAGLAQSFLGTRWASGIGCLGAVIGILTSTYTLVRWRDHDATELQVAGLNLLGNALLLAAFLMESGVGQAIALGILIVAVVWGEWDAIQEALQSRTRQWVYANWRALSVVPYFGPVLARMSEYQTVDAALRQGDAFFELWEDPDRSHPVYPRILDGLRELQLDPRDVQYLLYG